MRLESSELRNIRFRCIACRSLIALSLLGVACNTKSMTLSWQDTSENEDGFRIYRIAENQKRIIAEVGPNVTQYTDRSAPPNACYIITAFNAAGESGATNSACRQE
jgi:hypothetical protein